MSTLRILRIAFCLPFAMSFFALVAQPAVQQTIPTEVELTSKPSHDPTWWKHAVLYEIYPRSFQDSNGDGVGDLNGITQRLDYVRKLGVDAIWLAPTFPSPEVDFGYDISDYEAVDPQYGTMADMDRLIAVAGQRHIRVILDMVLNHTSDRHKWFLESASSRTNPKANWYLWNDGKLATDLSATAYEKRFEHEGRVPPNNWVSFFGGSAWEWSPVRKQFYYHNFYKQQPDLNWRNPAVEKAMFDAMRFWLDRGVAGFRLDAITALFEDAQLRNDEEIGGVNAWGDPKVRPTNTTNLPEIHDTIRRMRAMLDAYSGNRVLIGETNLPTTIEIDKWYGGAAHNELQLPMDQLVGIRGASFTAAHFRRYLTEIETQVHGSQPLIVFDNHDKPRSWDRFGDGIHNEEIAKAVATILLTTRATALIYQGQELGMHTSTPARVEDVKDPIGITGWPIEKGRDGERTPMQWDGKNSQAGFSTHSETWLPIQPDYRTVNVRSESADPKSLLTWYEQLIALRRSNPALRDGGMVMLNDADPDVFSFLRTAPSGSPDVLVAMNLTGNPKRISLDLPVDAYKVQSVHTLLSSGAGLWPAKGLSDVILPPFSSWVLELR
jgi:alpha-glucosidase